MSLLTDLIAYYPFDSTPVDVHGSGHNGDVFGGVSYGAGKIAAAIQFAAGKMALGTNPGNLSPQLGVAGAAFSISSWVKPTSLDAVNYATIVGRNDSGVGFYIKPDGHLSLWDFAHGSDHPSTGATVVTGSWQHVVFTFAGASGAYKFYLNGALLGGGGSGVAFDLSSTAFWMGADASGNGAYTGSQDETGIWSRELTPTEVTNLYNGGAALAYPLYEVPAPAVTSIAPVSGSEEGGTLVTLTGTGFQSGITVTFGGYAATSVTFVSSTTVTCRTPPGFGVVNIVVTNPDMQTGTF